MQPYDGTGGNLLLHLGGCQACWHTGGAGRHSVGVCSSRGLPGAAPVTWTPTECLPCANSNRASAMLILMSGEWVSVWNQQPVMFS